MPSKDPAIRLEDIIENITRIGQYTAGMDLDTFARDTKTVDAVERCLAQRTKKNDNRLEKTHLSILARMKMRPFYGSWLLLVIPSTVGILSTLRH
jgi:hypothetical protein